MDQLVVIQQAIGGFAMSADGEREMLHERFMRSERLTGIRRTMTRRGLTAARLPARRARARQRGQTMLIFALTFIALIGILGLAIDSARVYNQYGQMLRAAEAGALAGVIYMPDNYATDLLTSPFDNAICRAFQEVQKNGFGSWCDPTSQPAVVGSMLSICTAKAQASIEIAVCPDLNGASSDPYELHVSITETMNVVLLGALGVGPLTLTATATAAYLPPSGVGVDPTGPGGTSGWGAIGINNGASCKKGGSPTPRCWGANINGPGELKEQGDPLVSCEEGPSSLDPSKPNATRDGALTSTYTGLPTNHPQNGLPSGVEPTSCTNPDLTSAFNGPMYYDPGGSTPPARPGYSYFVNVPSGDPGEYLWVWNAPFAPVVGNNCNGNSTTNAQPYDVFFWDVATCSGGGKNVKFYQSYPGTSCPVGNTNSPYNCLDPKLYFSVTYSIYALQNVNTPITGNGPVASFTAWPYADIGGLYCELGSNAKPYKGNISAIAAATGQDCTVVPKCIATWCPIGNGLGDTVGDPNFPTPQLLGPGIYRVTVVTSDYGTPTDIHLGWGAHNYSLALCQSPIAGPTNGCKAAANAEIGGWGPSDYMLWFPGNNGLTEFPLAYVGSQYAGQTLDVRMFDAGDLLGTNGKNAGTTVFAIAPPAPAGQDACTSALTSGYSAASYTFVPSNERTSTVNSLPGIATSVNGDDIYNGLWVEEYIQIPGDYGAAGSPDPAGPWTICATGAQVNDADYAGFTVAALGSSPVHLKQ
jgi:hypothetical protein